MTNQTNVHRSRRSGAADAPLQTRANTIVKAADHGTPLELSDITIRYGGGKGGAEAVSVVEGFDLTLHAGLARRPRGSGVALRTLGAGGPSARERLVGQ